MSLEASSCSTVGSKRKLLRILNGQELQELKVGDVVTRWLAGQIPLELIVSKVTDKNIVCGLWEFCRLTGVEIDDAFKGIVVSFLGLSCSENSSTDEQH